MKNLVIIIGLLCFSIFSQAEGGSVCDPFPVAQAALEKNDELIKQLNDERQKNISKERLLELTDLIGGLRLGNSNLIDACQEATEKQGDL